MVRTKTRFDPDVKGNSEMTNYLFMQQFFHPFFVSLLSLVQGNARTTQKIERKTKHSLGKFEMWFSSFIKKYPILKSHTERPPIKRFFIGGRCPMPVKNNIKRCRCYFYKGFLLVYVCVGEGGGISAIILHYSRVTVFYKPALGTNRKKPTSEPQTRMSLTSIKVNRR